MKTLFSLVISFSILLSACTGKKSNDFIADKNQFVIGYQDSVKSMILGEWRKIWIYTPRGLEKNESYPTIYILDGDNNFHSLSGLAGYLMNTGQIPKMIIVAIPNTNRFRDLTPSKMETSFWDGKPLEENGGGDRFLDFIEKELKRHMEKNYPVNDYRMLVGHSLGGLTAIHTLVNRPELFTSYIAIDPSLWWDYQQLLKQADSVLVHSGYKSKSLFVGMANNMYPGYELEDLTNDTTKDNTAPRSVLKFVRQTQQKSPLNFNWKYYPSQSHNEIILITEYDAFQFLFSWYAWKAPKGFYEKDDSQENAISLLSNLKNHVADVSKRMRYEILPSASNVDNIGQEFLYQKKPMAALKFLEYNKEKHPDNGQVYKSLGDYQLEINKDTVSAKSYYTRAIDLGDKTSEVKIKNLMKK